MSLFALTLCSEKFVFVYLTVFSALFCFLLVLTFTFELCLTLTYIAWQGKLKCLFLEIFIHNGLYCFLATYVSIVT